jgi:Lon protease-like protein
MPNSDDLLGLFPLRLVLLPGEVVPLHIFEDRYKRLIGERRESGVFGLLLTDDDSVAEVGCTAVVHEVLEEFDDGRLNILVEGRERFRVLELVQPDDESADYLRARVRYFGDDAETPDEDDLSAQAKRSFKRMAALMGVETPRVPGGEGPLSFRLAAAVDFGLPLKQRLLESTVESERLELLVAVMNALLPGLELRKEREEAIRGNGKGN